MLAVEKAVVSKELSGIYSKELIVQWRERTWSMNACEIII